MADYDHTLGYERRKIIYDNLIRRKNLKNAENTVIFLKDEEGLYISERTFKADIKRMKEECLVDHKIYLKYDRKTELYGYYKFADGKYEVTNEFSFSSALYEDEKNALYHIMALIASFPNLQQMEVVHDLLERLGLKAGIMHPEKFKDYVQLDFVPDFKGNKHLGDLLFNVVNEEVIEINYQPFEDKRDFAIVHPYFLQEYNNRWFLWAFRENHPEHPMGVIHTYALDRIESTRVLDIDFNNKPREKYKVYPHTYLKNIVGNRLEPNKEKQEIQFKIRNNRAKYLETKKIHQSQVRIGNDDVWTTFKIEVIPNLELRSIFRSYGDDCELITQNIPFEPIQ